MGHNVNQTTLQIDLEPIGRRVDIAAGQTLLDAARARPASRWWQCAGEKGGAIPAWCGP